jgi:hypothetical protein
VKRGFGGRSRRRAVCADLPIKMQLGLTGAQASHDCGLSYTPKPRFVKCPRAGRSAIEPRHASMVANMAVLRYSGKSRMRSEKFQGRVREYAGSQKEL